ncbi:beta-glucuronosyltransferase GlcAT14A-like [Malania oleifera]|uniref:beta-glucuronosyltransferase GlcAT14A-like n=1 Tax=Malania oleifera TaxID=397392 RepID=UPI0025ADDB1B|nr:beta-glucuronosyltransferase GlcAT14A-like [Malania oleifera]
MANLSLPLIFSILPLSLLSLLLFLAPRTPLLRPRSRFLSASNLTDPLPPPPRIAYFVAGSKGDGARMLRLLLAIYHPRNQYLLHLDLRAPQRQREELAALVLSVDAFVAAGNVDVVGKADSVNYGGSTPLALVLHGAAILLRRAQDWDWFVNLDASDYPLIPQDDFLHILSFVPKEFNFIEHTRSIGWKEYQRVIQIVVDPGLYLGSKGGMFMGDKRRTLPGAFRFFTGSQHVILSRKLVEFSILGWDNLPRTLLLFFTNTRFSSKGYFQTLACNSKEFVNTVINSNLRFIAWDNPPQEEPRNLRHSDLKKMLRSGAAFAGKFPHNDPVLDRIDSTILHRGQGTVSPGGWCLGKAGRGRDPCWQWGDANILRPGPAAKRFEKLLLRLLRKNSTLHTNLCIQ